MDGGQNNQIPGAGGNPVRRQAREFLTVAELSAKMSSKVELYRFMATEVKAYLPSYETVTVFHLRDLASGTK